MRDLFTIGEIAKLFDINIRTLRYYDDIGLLKPEYTEENSGYRYYSTKQFERLNTIKYLRALNMPLSKIISFFENREIETLVSMLKEQQEDIRQKKAELEIIEQKIKKRLIQIEDAAGLPNEGIEEKRIGERDIVILKRNLKIGDDIEYPIAELGRTHHLNTAIFLGKVALSISKENLVDNKFDEFTSVILILEKEDKNTGNPKSIAAGHYLTLRFPGTHTDAKEHYFRLLDYMKEKNYRISGDSIEITIIDYGMTNKISKFVTEIQIPYEISYNKD